jgi:uncharacterized protein (TIGR02453 family)
MPFAGFSESTIRFLTELSRNDDRAWFEAHREEYESAIVEPAKAFVLELGSRLRELDPKIQAIPRVRGSIKAMERRASFRKTRTPRFKHSLDIWFWSGPRRVWDNSGFFLRLTPTDLTLAGGMIEFQKEALSRFREHVLDDERGGALVAIVDDLRAGGYVVGGESYKKPPRGVPADHPRAALSKHSGLFATLSGEHPSELETPAFVAFSFSHFSRMAELHAWLVALRSSPGK